tara:strand:+ start:81 stop:305 length:225 start_codon:yes stop_codon:yes gene_type:complete
VKKRLPKQKKPPRRKLQQKKNPLKLPNQRRLKSRRAMGETLALGPGELDVPVLSVLLLSPIAYFLGEKKCPSRR